VELNGQAHLAGVVSGSYVVGIGHYKVRGLDDIQAALNKERRRRDRRLADLRATSHATANTKNNTPVLKMAGAGSTMATTQSQAISEVGVGEPIGKRVSFDNKQERPLSGFEDDVDDKYNEEVETGEEDGDARYVAGLRAAQGGENDNDDDGNSDDERHLRSASTRAVAAYCDFGDNRIPPPGSLIQSEPNEPSTPEDANSSPSRFVLVVLQSPGPPAMASSLATTRSAGLAGFKSGMRPYYMTM